MPGSSKQHRFARDVARMNQLVTASGLAPVVALTLDQRPRTDSRELERLTGRFIENAAGNLIQNELEKGLQSLFGTQE